MDRRTFLGLAGVTAIAVVAGIKSEPNGVVVAKDPHCKRSHVRVGDTRYFLVPFQSPNGPPIGSRISVAGGKEGRLVRSWTMGDGRVGQEFSFA